MKISFHPNQNTKTKGSITAAFRAEIEGVTPFSYSVSLRSQKCLTDICTSVFCEIIIALQAMRIVHITGVLLASVHFRQLRKPFRSSSS